MSETPKRAEFIRLTRRESLKMICAGVAVAAVPATTAVAASVIVEQKNVAWAVGTPGEFNGDAIIAPDESTAKRWWAEAAFGECDCAEVRNDTDDPDYICEACSADVETTRVKSWDGLERITAGDWLAAGFGHTCSRCGEEVYLDDGGKSVGSEAVCSVCMTAEEHQ